MRRILLFILVFILWCLLVWPFDPVSGRLQVNDLYAGLFAAALVALIMKEVSTQNFLRWLNPLRFFWLVVYSFVFIFYIFKANLDVAYRVLHPDLPIKPGIVRVRTKLKTASGITMLANSVTLTPGTLTVDVTEGGVLYIHWINVTSTEAEAVYHRILGRFEWFIQKIFE